MKIQKINKESHLIIFSIKNDDSLIKVSILSLSVVLLFCIILATNLFTIFYLLALLVFSLYVFLFPKVIYEIQIDKKKQCINLFSSNKLGSLSVLELKKDSIKSINIVKTLGHNPLSIICIDSYQIGKIEISFDVHVDSSWFSPIKEKHSPEVLDLFNCLNLFVKE